MTISASFFPHDSHPRKKHFIQIVVPSGTLTLNPSISRGTHSTSQGAFQGQECICLFRPISRRKKKDGMCNLPFALHFVPKNQQKRSARGTVVRTLLRPFAILRQGEDPQVPTSACDDDSPMGVFIVFNVVLPLFFFFSFVSPGEVFFGVRRDADPDGWMYFSIACRVQCGSCYR